jgi:hypothetical protein
VPTLAKALRNPVYIARAPTPAGDVIERPVAHWPRLVDDETWLEVQLRRGRLLRPVTAIKHVLAGFVRCSGCGRPPGAQIRPGHPIIYYCEHCRTYVGAVEPPHGGVLDRVKFVVVTACVALRKRPAKFEAAWQSLQASDTRGDARAAAERVAAIDLRLVMASALFAEGCLDEIGYKLVFKALSRERDDARRSGTTQNGARLPSFSAIRKRILGWYDQLAREDVAGHRDVLADLVTQVQFARLRRGEYVPQIRWTLLGESVMLACRHA